VSLDERINKGETMSKTHDESSQLPLPDSYLDFLNSLEGSEFDYAVAYERWWVEGGQRPKVPEDASLVRASKIRKVITSSFAVAGLGPI
jgi:hypothetical protein